MHQWLLIHFDQFVAGGDDGDARLGEDIELGRTTGGGCGDLGGGDTRARGHDHVSGPGFGSPGNDVFAGSDAAALSEAERVAVTLRVFHHDHAVGAIGYRCAGHYFDRLSSRDFDRPGLAGADQSNDCQRQAGCKVGGPAGKAVAGGAGKWRLIAVGINRHGQHHAQAIGERHELRRVPRRSGEPICMLPDDPAGVGKADHSGWSGVVQARDAKRGDARCARRPLS